VVNVFVKFRPEVLRTRKARATPSFKVRVSRMTHELGVAFTENEGELAYDLRSSLAHGESFLSVGVGPPQPERIALYDRIEMILRMTILRAYRDSSYALHFADLGCGGVDHRNTRAVTTQTPRWHRRNPCLALGAQSQKYVCEAVGS